MKLCDAEIVNTIGVPKVVSVLRAIYRGIEVNLNGHRVQLAKTRDNNEEPIIILYEDDILGIGDWSVASFIRACNKLSDEEIFRICGNITLNRIKEKKR